MFTVCPKCALTLVVTAADLRVAQGYVRCGRCSSVFNALARLADDRQTSGAGAEALAAADAPPASFADEAPEAPSSAAADAVPSQAPEAAEEPAPSPAADEEPPEEALEFNPATTDVSSVFVEPPPNPHWTAATGSFKAMVAANQEPAAEELPDSQVDVEIDAAFLASMLAPEAPAREPERAPPSPPAPAAAPLAAPPPAPPSALAPAPVPVPVPPSAHSAPPARARPNVRHPTPHTRPAFEATVRPAVASRVPAAQAARADPADEPDEATLDTDIALQPAARADDTLRRWLPLVWRIGAGLAVLVLGAQIVNHHRDELAASARFSRPLTALYASLGVHLVPRWDVHAYDVRQLGASVDTEGAGTITVRASIKNAAQQPQPLPMLRVTLQDRFGNRIASSDVAPRFYLPHAIPASSFLSAGQRIDAQMGFVDPGASAVGFELDACLPASGGGLTCANDTSTR